MNMFTKVVLAGLVLAQNGVGVHAQDVFTCPNFYPDKEMVRLYTGFPIWAGAFMDTSWLMNKCRSSITSTSLTTNTTSTTNTTGTTTTTNYTGTTSGNTSTSTTATTTTSTVSTTTTNTTTSVTSNATTATTTTATTTSAYDWVTDLEGVDGRCLVACKAFPGPWEKDSACTSPVPSGSYAECKAPKITASEIGDSSINDYLKDCIRKEGNKQRSGKDRKFLVYCPKYNTDPDKEPVMALSGNMDTKNEWGPVQCQACSTRRSFSDRGFSIADYHPSPGKYWIPVIFGRFIAIVQGGFQKFNEKFDAYRILWCDRDGTPLAGVPKIADLPVRNDTDGDLLKGCCVDDLYGFAVTALPAGFEFPHIRVTPVFYATKNATHTIPEYEVPYTQMVSEFFYDRQNGPALKIHTLVTTLVVSTWGEQYAKDFVKHPAVKDMVSMSLQGSMWSIKPWMLIIDSVSLVTQRRLSTDGHMRRLSGSSVKVEWTVFLPDGYEGPPITKDSVNHDNLFRELEMRASWYGFWWTFEDKVGWASTSVAATEIVGGGTGGSPFDGIDMTGGCGPMGRSAISTVIALVMMLCGLHM